MELKNKNTIHLPIPKGKGIMQQVREMEEESKAVAYKELSLEELNKVLDRIHVSVITEHYDPILNKIINSSITKILKHKLIKNGKR